MSIEEMTKEKLVYIPAQELKNFMKKVFLKVGVPEADAEICSEILLQADLRGIDSHGINRLKMYVDRIRDGIQFPVTQWKLVEDRGATAVLDAAHGMGHVAAYNAMKIAIDKASQHGCGVVTVKNGTHFGIAGYYSLMAVERNMIGMTLTNARPSVAPTFGTEPLLGTNPIALGAPSDMPYPFLLDMATSIIQRGRVEVLDKLGMPVAKGLVVNRDGRTAQNSHAILKDLTTGDAALLALGGLGETMGGHKGYGLATMVEILSTALSNANFLHETSGVENGKQKFLGLGHFFMAIDVSFFISVELFKKIVGNILRELQNSHKSPEYEKIYVAGEKEYLMTQKRKDKGIPIDPSLAQMMIGLKKQFCLDEINLPF